MISGTVNNQGVNNGTQAGNIVTGGTFVQGHYATSPLLNGTVNNGFFGVNFGTQAGNLISGGRFRQF
jgi:hypothetical protein